MPHVTSLREAERSFGDPIPGNDHFALLRNKIRSYDGFEALHWPF